MLFIVSFAVIGGLIGFFIMRAFYRKSRKKERTAKFKNFVSIMGVINLLLSVVFMIMYLINPEAFSSEAAIASPVLLVLFTLFSLYFYIAAPVLSIGGAGVSFLQKRHETIGKSKFLLNVIVNIIGACLILLVTYFVFG